MRHAASANSVLSPGSTGQRARKRPAGCGRSQPGHPPAAALRQPHLPSAASPLGETPLTLTGAMALGSWARRADDGLYDDMPGAAAGADDLYGDLYNEHGDEGHTLLKEKNAQVGRAPVQTPKSLRRVS